MTKKETIKQPRDGNGKFAKMIKVEDKWGNVAYFTLEEIAGFKSTPLKNPDCEPATKRYVKSLIRKTRDHTHILKYDGHPTVVCIIGGWLFTIMLGICCIKNINIGLQYFIPVFLFTIAMTCIFYEFSAIEVEEIKGFIPTELYTYNTPRRDECEEE
jgi:hypothetical protein